MAVATLLAVCVNGLLFQHDRERYSIRFVPYNALYHVRESPRVRNLDLEGSTLRLQISGLTARHWVSKSRAPLQTDPDGAPLVPLEEGLHTYRIVPVGAPWHAIEFSALHSPGEPVTIGHTNVPFRGAPRFAIRDFATPGSAYPAEERERARSVLDAAGVELATDEVERLERLAAHLLRELEPYRGAPALRARFADGLRQYEMALAGETKLYCANLSEIFAAFANLAGIPTRVVDLGGALGDAQLGAHTFTESYLQRHGGWVYVDLQLEVLHVRSASGDFLNGAQLLRLEDSHEGDGLEAAVLRQGEITVVPFSEVHDLVGSFVHPSASLTYHLADPRRFSLGSRILRHTLRPEPAHALGARSNMTLWARSVAQLGLLGIAFVWLARLARWTWK